MKRFQLFINNEWVEAENKETFLSYDPATGEAIAELAKASEADVDRAIEAAHKAFASGIWSELTAEERLAHILKVTEILKRRFEEFAQWESRDTGKPIRETRTVDIPISIKALEYHARTALTISGQTIRLEDKNRFDYTTYEPLGVIGVITPWNYPLHLFTRAVAPALAAGNTVVVKASSLTPVTAQLMGEVFLEAGFPKGVVNIVSGPGEITGKAILNSPYVKAVSFTGSEEVGRSLLEQSSKSPTIKKLILELGGKGPLIAHGDCNIDGAVKSIMKGFISNMGEVCCASSRLYVQDVIYEELMERLLQKVAELTIGDPRDLNTMIGSLINKKQLERVDAYVQGARADGAVVLCGGTKAQLPAPFDNGSFYMPTILTNLKHDMRCVREEIFGPVLCVFKYHDLEEAVQMANDTDFGLGACIWSEDPRTLIHAARKLDAGTIWMNDSTSSQVEAPYGGNKNSGVGRENGQIGLLEYMKVKNHIWYIGPEYDNYFNQ